MAHIKDLYFHIKGTPKQDEVFETVTDNYVRASLVHDKGKGYYLSIGRMGKFMFHDDYTGKDVPMQSFSMGDKAPSRYECLVPCGRASKARGREAIEMFNSYAFATVRAIGYDVEEEVMS